MVLVFIRVPMEILNANKLGKFIQKRRANESLRMLPIKVFFHSMLSLSQLFARWAS